MRRAACAAIGVVMLSTMGLQGPPLPQSYQDITFQYALDRGWAGTDGMDNIRIPAVAANFNGSDWGMSFHRQEPAGRMTNSRTLVGESRSLERLGVAGHQSVGPQLRDRRQPPPEVTRKPPYPYAIAPERILANILFGVRAMKLHLTNSGELFGRKDALEIGRLLDVESDTIGNYYLAHLNDKAGRPYATVIISKEGWIKSVGDVRSRRPPRVPELNVVGNRLEERFGGPVTTRYYFTGGTVPSGATNEYVPLIKADTPDGQVYVDLHLDVWREQSFERFEPGDLSPDAPRKHAGQHILVRRDGVSRMTKIGSLAK